MITLILNSKNQKGKRQQFVIGHNELGIVFDMTRDMINDGYSLVDIKLGDGTISINIPPDVFTKKSFDVVFNQLKIEWEQLLTQSILNASSQTESIRIRVGFNDVEIVFLESATVKLEVRLSKRYPRAPHLFQQLIDQYQLILDKTHSRKEKNTERLHTLSC